MEDRRRCEGSHGSPRRVACGGLKAAARRAVRAGFTLIELLTVMAIISILIAILLPSLSGARNRGRITKCEANVRELAQATLRYISQQEDRFPTVSDCEGNACYFGNGHQYFGWNGRQPGPLGRPWARWVNKELGLQVQEANPGGAAIAECPSDGGAPGQTGENGKLFELLGSSYAMNPILSQGRYSDWKYRDYDLGLSQVIQPSQKVLVADHVAFGLTFDGYWTAIRPGWHDTYRPAAVVGFIDGHAEYVTNRCGLREWQWYGEATGTQFVQALATKVKWPVQAGCE